MEREQFLDGFKFHHDTVFNDEIDAVRTFELDALIDDRQTNLMSEFQTLFGKLISKTRVVGAFEAPGAERGVHFHRCAENSFSDRYGQPQDFSSASSVSSVVESQEQDPALQS